MSRLNNVEGNKCSPRAFTLLELLVVISIIAILAGMVMPTFYYAKKRAREAKARVAVKQLETAFKSYLETYKLWPADFVDGNIEDNIFKILRGDNVSGANAQQISFFEFESYTNYPSQTTAYDAWSGPADPPFSLTIYQVMFDRDYDNRIDALPDVYRPVLVWSFGENRTNEYGGGDDVASWK